MCKKQCEFGFPNRTVFLIIIFSDFGNITSSDTTNNSKSNYGGKNYEKTN